MSQTTPYHPANRASVSPSVRKTLSVPPKPSSHPAGASGAPVVNSDHLLQGTQCVNIVHNDQVYQLRATRYGKLILTK